MNKYVRLIIHSDSKQLNIINDKSSAFIQEKHLLAKKEKVLR